MLNKHEILDNHRISKKRKRTKREGELTLKENCKGNLNQGLETGWIGMRGVLDSKHTKVKKRDQN